MSSYRVFCSGGPGYPLALCTEACAPTYIPSSGNGMCFNAMDAADCCKQVYNYFTQQGSSQYGYQYNNSPGIYCDDGDGGVVLFSCLGDG